MADTPASSTPNPQQPNIQVITQYIRDLSFENPNAPESLVSGWAAPEPTIQIVLGHRQVNDNAYECNIHLRVEAKNKENSKVAFIVDLHYGALAVLQNIPTEAHHQVIMIEVPKMLFPFAREIIASAVAQGGYPPLYITPISFEGLYMAEMQRLQAEKEGTRQAS